MTYKLGDRVVINSNNTWLGANNLIGYTGVVTSLAGSDMVGVHIDERNTQLKTGRIYFRPDELEHDKNYIVTQILEDL